MSNVVNLNKARKARDRAQAKEHARENRVKFGRSRAEKDLAQSETKKAERILDGAKRETED